MWGHSGRKFIADSLLLLIRDPAHYSQVNLQGELGFDAPRAADGYGAWVAGRKRAVEVLARRVGLPLEHEVEVWLRGGIRLQGKLRLADEKLFLEEENLNHLELCVGRVRFFYRELDSCVRLD